MSLARIVGTEIKWDCVELEDIVLFIIYYEPFNVVYYFLGLFFLHCMIVECLINILNDHLLLHQSNFYMGIFVRELSIISNG